MTEQQKIDYIKFKVLNDYDCLFQFFLANVGDFKTMTIEIADLNTEKELDEYISKYI